MPAEFAVPANPAGWVVVARPSGALAGPGVEVTTTTLGQGGLATMVVDLPQAELATMAGWIHVAATHLRSDLASDLPIAYLGSGSAAAAGWMAAVGGELNGVLAWNGRPGPAWAQLPSVPVPSLLVVDEGAPWLLLLAKAARWRLGSRADVLPAAAPDDAGLLATWYHDRLLRPSRPVRSARRVPPRRRAASVGVAAALGAVAPAGVVATAVATTAAAGPALAAPPLPDFSSGNRLAAVDIDGDDKATGPIGDPPLTDGIGVRWNINTNVGFTTTSSASGAVSEAGFTHAAAATTLNGGTVNQVLADAFDGYNALCVDLNNVGGQCNTANMAVYNQNGPASLECSGRQVVLPLRNMGPFQVRRKVFVPTNEGFARWLNIVRNTSAAPQTVRLQTSNNLGSDANTRIVTTSDGDATPELSDTWVTTFQNFSGTTSPDPRLGHVLRGPGAAVGLSAISFVNGDDNPFWRYQFTLAPNQTAIIMNFATGQATRAAAATESAQLASLSSANALACMTTAEREQVVNFQLGSPSHGTFASPGGPLGTAVSADSTLGGFSSPTGTMTFNLYGPGDDTCIGAPVFTNTVPVNGNGTYNSGLFTPTAVGTYIWTAAYSGDGINPPSTTPCNSATASVVITPAGPATPTLTTQASVGGPLGTQVTDTATLSGGNNPTGTIQFWLWAPNDLTCTGSFVFTDTVSVNGNGNYTSDPFTPTAPGTYRWTAQYLGDANNAGTGTLCNDPNESVTIIEPTPTITTQASAGGPIGTQVTDTATLSGGYNPTGTIAFDLYGPDNATCSGAPVFSDIVSVNGNGMYTSGPFTPTAPGTYRWTSYYSGDVNNLDNGTLCNDANESVVITQASPTISTQASAGGPVGTQVTDTATISGGFNPTGILDFFLTGPDDPTCAGAPIFHATVGVNGNGNYTTGPFAVPAPGTYRWTVFYTGDANNAPTNSPCNALNESVVITQAGPGLTTQASAGGPIGTPVSDTATLTGGVNPTGTITFRLYGPDDATCAGAHVYSATIPVLGNGNYNSGNANPTAAGTYRWTAVYDGDPNNAPATSPCGAPNESVVITQAQPTISTQASAGGPVGTPVNDTATVSGGFNPTGTVTFALFSDANCTAQVSTSTSPLVGGSSTSVSFTPIAPGTYFWTAVYNGDANNATATSGCNAPNESVVITQAQPTISTQASAGGPVGSTSVTDTATLSGGFNPTGTMQFYLFGPDDPTCATAAVSITFRAVAGNGNYTSDPFTPTVPGTYRWLVNYTGDANNASATSPCNAANESVTITRAQPTITTQASSGAQVTATGPTASITDTATVAGGLNPTGTLTFFLFGPNDATCAGIPVFTDTVAVSGNGVYTSDPFTTDVLGTYRWVVTYPGDANNLPASSPCNAPNETSEVTSVCAAKPPPGTLPGNTIVIAAPGQLTAGTPGDDVIYGTAGEDRIDARGGNDIVFGQGGNDYIVGGTGLDTLCGGDGNDQLVGWPDNDLLSGEAGDDALAGGDGDDLLIGGAGFNRLAGGTGTNTCIPGTNPGDALAQCQIVPGVAADFDGDLDSDVSVFREGSGTWFAQDGATTAWGTSGNIPVPGDYDGDADIDIAVFRPSTGTWFIQGGPTVAWGTSGDIPVPGDYDGDGSTEIAVFRPASGIWFVQGGPTVAWGTAGDIPVPGDYDGDGTTDFAVFRPSTGTWFIEGGPIVAWGTSGDIPVPGDYDGDGTTDIAVFRPSTGTWFIEGGSTVAWGTSGDVPVPGDYDADADTDIAVFRPSTGTWFVEGGLTTNFGTMGDQPLPLPSAIYTAFF